MNSVQIRRLTTGPILQIVLGALALVSGEYGKLGHATDKPNATMWLRRLRDVRRNEVKLMAERLGSDRLELCLMGAKVRVESDKGQKVLVGRANAVIGNLMNPATTSEPTVFATDGSGLAGPHYTVFR